VEERRFVVVLFAQAPGLADLPETERRTAADGLFSLLRGVIERHGGRVDKFIGDVVMARWGAPVAHEDDAVRAVRAALEMVREAEAESRERGRDLRIRCGLNRGEVYFGSVAGDRTTVMGDPVNVAQRLQDAAEPGRVLASRSVERLTHRVIAWRPLEAMALRGRKLAVQAFEATAGTAESGPRLSAPMVGRAGDLRALRDAAEEAAAGKAAFVVLKGEAGIGKSRLAAELADGLRALPADWGVLAGRALPDVRLPLLAFGDMLRAEAGVAAGTEDGPARLVEFLVEELAPREPGREARENHAHLIARSLGYALGEVRVGAIEPERLAAETHFAWEQWIRTRAARGPLLVCVEDLQWADDATRALLDHLAARARDAALLIVVTARPETVPPPGWRVLALGDLPAEAVFELAESLFGAPLSLELTAFMAEKSGSNPLYIEELARFLRDERLADGNPVSLRVPPDRVPDGLHGLLVARLDAVPGNDRQVLKAASAVGRSFWASLLARLLEREVDASLTEACTRDLVVEQKNTLLSGDREFAFRHALLRDAAYSLLTRKDRQRLHAATADLLEARGGGRRVRVLAARHRESAGQHAAAAELWLDAAREALAEPSWGEATAYAREAVRSGGGDEAHFVAARSFVGAGRYEEAVAEARGAAGSGDPDCEARIFVEEARALRGLGRYDNALERLAQAGALAASPSTRFYVLAQQAKALNAADRLGEAREATARAATAAESAAAGSPPRQVAWRKALLARLEAGIASKEADHGSARRGFEAGLELSRECGDRIGVASCLSSLGTVDLRVGDYAAALRRQTEALSIQRSAGDRSGAGSSLLSIASVHVRRGALSDAEAAMREGLRLFREISDATGISQALNNLGNALYQRSAWDEALAAYRESLEMRRAAGDRRGVGSCLNNIGVVHLVRGDWAEALAVYSEGLEISRQAGDRVSAGTLLENLGHVHRLRGSLDAAAAAYAEALSIYRDIGDKPGVVGGLRGLGALQAMRGELGDSRRFFEEALTLCRAIGDRASEGTGLESLGILQEACGEAAAAEASFRDALALHDAIGNRAGRAMSLARLAGVLRTRGALADASTAADEAARLNEELGQKPELREALLESARCSLAAGRAGAAAETALRARDLALADDDSLRATLARLLLGRARFAQGRRDEAREALAEALAEKREPADFLGLTSRLFHLAELRRDLGDFGEARLAASESARLARQGNAAGVLRACEEILQSVSHS